VWFSFGGEVDPQNIAIIVDENIHNLDDRTLYGSLIMPRDSSLLYGAFLNQLHHSRDVPVSWATGFLKFDAGSREFRISNLEKLNEQSNPGNYVALNTKTCEMKGEGKLQLVQKTGYVDVSSVGTYSFNTIDRKSDFKTSFGVNFLFDEALLQMIADDIQKEGLNGIDIDNAIYELTLRETLGKEAADDMISKMSLGKTVKVPEEFRKTLFFSEVQFKWNENTQSYMSKGKLKLANMGKSAVNVEIEGAIELVQSRGATDINILLQVNNGKWYMFNYKASTGYMKVYSTNPELHTKINEVKTDKRRIKGDKDNRQYQYIVGTKRMKTDFDLRIEEAK
jgi:hypothetical protein